MATALTIPLDEHGALSLQQQLYTRLRDDILAGRLRSGERLPPSRLLSAQLAVSRTTVVLVYDQLVAEGYAEARQGAGTYVSRQIPDDALAAAQGPHPLVRPASDHDASPSDRATGQLSAWGARMADVHRLVWGADGRVAERFDGDLLMRLSLDPGDRAALEDPGYSGAALALRAHGMDVQPIPVDEDGLDVRALPDPLDPSAPRLVYVTPSHQFPTGATLSLPRRLRLLEWAARRGALIVEDDYDSEFRYLGRPLESLQGLDTNGVVAYLGSFSKALSKACDWVRMSQGRRGAPG